MFSIVLFGKQYVLYNMEYKCETYMCLIFVIKKKNNDRNFFIFGEEKKIWLLGKYVI